MAQVLLAFLNSKIIVADVAALGLQQNLSMGQTLSPQMRSPSISASTPLELQSLIQQEIEINPVLEEALKKLSRRKPASTTNGTNNLEELRQKTRIGGNTFLNRAAIQQHTIRKRRSDGNFF